MLLDPHPTSFKTLTQSQVGVGPRRPIFSVPINIPDPNRSAIWVFKTRGFFVNKNHISLYIFSHLFKKEGEKNRDERAGEETGEQ